MELTGKTQRQGLGVILVFTFFMAMGFDMVMPLIIGHFVNDLAFSATAVAGALALRQFSQQGLALVGGALADRFNARTLIASGVLLRSIAFAALAFADSYGLLLIAMALTGIGGMFFEIPYQTAMAVLTTPQNRSRYYSLNNTVTGIASAIAPILGVALLRLDFKAVCFGAALCFAANFVISCLIMPDIKRGGLACSPLASLKAVASDKSYLGFVLAMAIFWLAAAQIDITYPLRVTEIHGSADGIAVMYSVYAIVVTAFQYPLVTLLLRKLRERQCALLGCAMIAAAIFLTALAGSLPAFMATLILFAAGMTVARPNQQNIAVSMANPKALGMYLGVNSLAFAIGKGTGTILGGAAYDAALRGATPAMPWMLFGGIATIATLAFAAFSRGEMSRVDTGQDPA